MKILDNTQKQVEDEARGSSSNKDKKGRFQMMKEKPKKKNLS